MAPRKKPGITNWTAIAFGRIGGKKRMSALTPEQRKELARLAANTRWSKKKEAK